MAVREELLKTLEELGDDEFKQFKWYLKQSDNLEGSSVIPKSHLDKVDRPDTVDKILQTYNQQSVEVLKKTLKKINRNDLVEELSNTSTGVRGKLRDRNMKLGCCDAKFIIIKQYILNIYVELKLNHFFPAIVF